MTPRRIGRSGRAAPQPRAGNACRLLHLRGLASSAFARPTIERCADAGADVFVAGSAVYGAADPAEAVRALRNQAEAATAKASWACDH
jgi:hypothetical protein